MSKNSYLGIYVMGHAAALERISYMLCSPKVRFTPELDNEYIYDNLNDEKRDQLQKFIESNGAAIFRNVTNRQKYVPVTRADLARFLFGEKDLYAETNKPWTPASVNFSNLFGLCLISQDEYAQIVKNGVTWTPADHGLYYISDEDMSIEFSSEDDDDDLEDDDENGSFTSGCSYEEIFQKPPVCVYFDNIILPSLPNNSQNILHVRFMGGAFMPLIYLRRLMSRYGANSLVFSKDPDGTVSWFYFTAKEYGFDADQVSNSELQKKGFDPALCRKVFNTGPAASSGQDFSFYSEYEDFDPVAEAIRHVEESRD